MELSVCTTDDDYVAWRQVRLVVEPGNRTFSVAEMRELDSPDRVMWLARDGGVVVGCGLGDRGHTGAGFVMPRVLPEHRRKGAGSALLRAALDHCAGLQLTRAASSVDDEGALAFATGFGFAEIDREVEQTRYVGDESAPSAPPEGVEVVEASPELWAACYETFGREVLADFALYAPLEVSADDWNTEWLGNPMWLAVADGEVVGCAGLNLDDDRPERAENALTAVRRNRRGTGLASHLKRVTLNWAARNGISEIYTWTQVNNASMLRLNEHLGYETTQVSITVSRDL